MRLGPPVLARHGQVPSLVRTRRPLPSPDLCPAWSVDVFHGCSNQGISNVFLGVRLHQLRFV
jgi:hypothetical protein